MFALGSSWLLYRPHSLGTFRAEDMGWVTEQFLIASFLGLLVMVAEHGHLQRLGPHGNQRMISTVWLRRAVLLAGGLAALRLAQSGIDLAVVAGDDRSTVREGAPIVVAVLGYLMPLAAIFFAHASGTIKNRWTIGTLAASLSVIVVGFRGLALTGLLALAVVAVHLGHRPNRRVLAAIGLGSTGILAAMSALRPQASSGLYSALMNRAFYTSAYQIEKVRELAGEQPYPGSWLVRDLAARIGSNEATLQQAVWRADFGDGSDIGGSYSVIGDLIGNFGAAWWVAYAMLLLLLLWWDVSGVFALYRFGRLINSCLLVVTARVAVFGLAAALTPLALIGFAWVVGVRGRRRAPNPLAPALVVQRAR